MFLLIFYCRAPGLINIKVFDQDSENDYSGVILHCDQGSSIHGPNHHHKTKCLLCPKFFITPSQSLTLKLLV